MKTLLLHMVSKDDLNAVFVATDKHFLTSLRKVCKALLSLVRYDLTTDGIKLRVHGVTTYAGAIYHNIHGHHRRKSYLKGGKNKFRVADECLVSWPFEVAHEKDGQAVIIQARWRGYQLRTRRFKDLMED